MTVGTVISRITGLGRLIAIAAAFGVAESRIADTYNLANVAPNIIYELVLGGVLTSVFVPVIVDLFETEGKERAWQVASGLINISLVILVGISILGILGAPLLAKLYSFRLEGDQAARQQEVLTFLLRIFIPQIIFYALAAITAGLLNAHKRFAGPMFTPILNNIAVIAVFVGFYKAYGAVTLATITPGQLWLIGLATTGGIALMACAQLPMLRGLGKYHLTLKPRHPSVRKLGRLSLFVVGYVVVNQIGYLIVQVLANAEQGAYTAYLAAFQFFILPHGLFAVSVTTALLPSLSKHASNGRWPEYRRQLSTAMRATLLFMLPATAGFLIMGHSIIRVLLEHGVMTGTSTELVVSVLRFFVLGLAPFSLFQLFARAFYAMQDTKTPFVVNCAAVALNTAINVPMFAWLGVEGLAVGHASAYIFGSIIQGRILSARVGGVDGRRFGLSFLRISAATAVMAVAVAALMALTRGWMGSPAGDVLSLVAPAGAGALVFLGAARILRVEEMSLLKGLVGRT